MRRGYAVESTQNSSNPELRRRNDRRTSPTSPVSWSSLSGSRRRIRRKEDRANHFYVDRYDPATVLAFLCTLLLSVADAFLTLKLVHAGATELNPVMDFYLRAGPLPFLMAKYLLTASCLILLLVHKNCRVLAGRITTSNILFTMPFLYGLLIAYEMNLILSLG
jgi:hypothetical protein